MFAGLNKSFEEGIPALREKYPQIDWRVVRTSTLFFITGYVKDGLAVSVRESAKFFGRYKARITPVKKVMNLHDDAGFCLLEGPVRATPLKAIEGLLSWAYYERERLKKVETVEAMFRGTNLIREPLSESSSL